MFLPLGIVDALSVRFNLKVKLGFSLNFKQLNTHFFQKKSEHGNLKKCKYTFDYTFEIPCW